MAFKTVDVVKVIKDVVATIPNVFFEHGEGIEVFNTIKNVGKVNIETFPLIYLKQDFKETSNPEDETTNVSLSIYIITPTEIHIKASERLDTTFRPILYPIYEQLLNALKEARTIQNEYGKAWHSHSKWDRLFWGTQQLEGNRPLDVIEIENLELKIINKRC